MADDEIAVTTARALGTGVQVAVTDERRLQQAMSAVLDWLAELEHAASRFRADSEITRLNQARGKPVEVSLLFARVIEVALRVAAMTGGIVDPTVGSAMEAIGYDRDFADVPRATGRPPTRPAAPAPGFQTVLLDVRSRTVQLPPGVHLDVGSSAKAFAADETAGIASAATGAGVLVNLGGDIAVAGPAPSEGWPIRVTDDHAAPADAPGQTVAIRSGGLATSSTTVRAWRDGNTLRHHIVDPSTGEPVPVIWRTVSATASTCVTANAASTAAIVLGRDAERWLRRGRIPARLVSGNGVVRHVNGWPDADRETVIAAR